MESCTNPGKLLCMMDQMLTVCHLPGSVSKYHS